MNQCGNLWDLVNKYSFSLGFKQTDSEAEKQNASHSMFSWISLLQYHEKAMLDYIFHLQRGHIC